MNHSESPSFPVDVAVDTAALRVPGPHGMAGTAGDGAGPYPALGAPAGARSPAAHRDATLYGPAGAGAVLVADGAGTVVACTAEAAALLGDSVGELTGRRVDELFTDQKAWHELTACLDGGPPYGRRLTARHGAAPVELHARLLPLDGATDAAAAYALQLAPAADAERRQEEDALVRTLFSQSRVGLTIHDSELRATRTNLAHDCFRQDPGASPDAPLPDPRHPESFLEPDDAAHVVASLRRVAETGEPLIDVPHRARCRGKPQTERVVSLSALPLQGAAGHGRGLLTSVSDVTQQHRDKRRLAMLNGAAKRIGTSLDLTRCAEELTEFFVPDYADLVAVDLTEVVLVGEEPVVILRGAPFTRVAVASSDGVWPPELYARGETAQVRRFETEYLRKCSATLPDWDEMHAAFADDEHRSKLLLPNDAASYLFVPLHARGLVLGSVNLWRKKGRVPFDAQDAELAEEIMTRAALALDNARRYTQERRTAEALRHSLLPPPVVEISAAEAAGTCLPAATTAGVGGTWFDVIPLSSTRVAFVVGDSVGHGLEATAATGRLRTAVQTLSDLDLPPDELLAHLDDLVLRLSAADHSAPGGTAAPESGTAGRIKGSTCLYAVYDPVTGSCIMASAGHAPPALITPDGRSRLVDCVPGPPLGEGSDPFEPVELALQPGSLLAFYSGNLLLPACGPSGPAPDDAREQDDGDPDDAGPDDAGGTGEPRVSGSGVAGRLCGALDAAAARDRTPAAVGRDALARLVPEPPAADTTLLVARPRGLAPGQTACWEFPADPEVVGRAREAVTHQLADWDLEELAGTTELIASELVTNAIRYAGSPVQLRLVRDETLICEVSDPTQTQPHLRRARPTDEGGRGLFLVHQLTQRWGSRYTSAGKTIWTEQPLPAAGL